MTRHELESMSMAQLRELAAQHGIIPPAQMRKPGLITTLCIALAAPERELPKRQASKSAPRRHAASVPSAPMQDASTTGSSPRPVTPTAAVVRAPVMTDAGAGLPIPDCYGMDRLVAMVQDPRHIFVYWELTAERYAAMRALAGDDALPVLVIEGPHGTEQRVVDLSARNYYVTVNPRTHYVLAVALRDRSGTLHRLMPATSIRMPAASPSADESEDWLAVDDIWTQLVSEPLPGTSISRLRVDRRISTQRVEVSSEGAALHQHLSSAADNAGQSSHLRLSSKALSDRALPSSLTSSRASGSSRTVSSFALSSHSVGSGHQLNHEHTPYSLHAAFDVVPSGLPTESSSTVPDRPRAPAPSLPTQPGPEASPLPPSVADAPIGSPKLPTAQRLPVPRR